MRVKMKPDKTYASRAGSAGPGQLTPDLPEKEARALIEGGYALEVPAVAAKAAPEVKAAPVEPAKAAAVPEQATREPASERATGPQRERRGPLTPRAPTPMVDAPAAEPEKAPTRAEKRKAAPTATT